MEQSEKTVGQRLESIETRLAGIEDKGLLGTDFSHDESEGILLWKNYTHDGDFYENGVICVLEFEVIGGAAGEEIPVSLSKPTERFSAMNMGMENVPVELEAGSVTVGTNLDGSPALYKGVPLWPFLAGGGVLLAAAAGVGAWLVKKKKKK